MRQFKLYLLGPPRLEQDGQPLKLGRRKALAMLAYLASSGKAVRRETLAAMFWPDASSSAAFSSLRRDLSVLNRELGSGYLNADRDEVELAQGDGEDRSLWVDILRFRTLMQQCASHGHPARESCPLCIPLLEEAVALHNDDFMRGFSLPDSLGFDNWQLEEQETLRRELTQALDLLAHAYVNQGAYERAIPHVRRWLQSAPWHESAHRLLMALFSWIGDRAAALRQYAECMRLLQEELGQPPEQATQELYESILAGEPPRPPAGAQQPASRLGVGRPTLPLPDTPLVDRREETDALKERLLHNPSCRLITLIGPGGIGKTRLAVQVASEVQEAFPHGAFMVPLAPIESPALLIPTIADALGLTFRGHTTPQDQLLNYLREKNLLLLLDNFEHIIEGAVLLPDILSHAPSVKLLVTSRQRLNLHAEWVHSLRGLDYPETDLAGQDSTADETVWEQVLTATGGVSVQGYDSVCLFLQSIRRVRPDFELLQEDRRFVVRICRLVEGMPLGLELAAAWTRMMPLAEIEQEIKSSLDFLSTRIRDMPARHRSLRVLFEQSWQFLSDSERRAASKLSVFRAGFGRDAAEKVAGASPHILAAVIDKSIVRAGPSGRYHMHELLRQFALEKLDASPQAVREARDAHCTYFAAFLQAREERLQGAEQRQAANEIAAEIDNVRTAWRWAVSNQKAAEIGQSLESLHLFYYARGWAQEGYETFQEARDHLAKAEDPACEPVVNRLQARLGRFAFRLGMHREAGEWLRKSLFALDRIRSEEAIDVRRETAFCLFCLSGVLRLGGDHAEARQFCTRSYELYRECGDRPGMAMSLKLLGIINGSLKNFERAQHRLEQALELYQEIGDPYGRANTLNDLAIVAAGLGRYDVVQKLHQECLAVRREIGDLWGTGTSLNNLGYAALLAHEYASARAFLLESLEIQREIGDQYHIANCLINLSTSEQALEQRREAADRLYEALQLASRIGATPLILEALTEISGLLADNERSEGIHAAELLAFVLNHPLTDRWTWDRAQRRLEQLAADLPEDELAAARERGRAGKLEEVVAETLDQIKSWSTQKGEYVALLATLKTTQDPCPEPEQVTHRSGPL